mmetsp:Transcript_38029/g.93473  ORF Transcript_38029/g.93473 Transcript_38029/m.93473 type:complete len:209 (+) Transcript_38029:800-1426(+)
MADESLRLLSDVGQVLQDAPLLDERPLPDRWHAAHTRKRRLVVCARGVDEVRVTLFQALLTCQRVNHDNPEGRPLAPGSPDVLMPQQPPAPDGLHLRVEDEPECLLVPQPRQKDIKVLAHVGRASDEGLLVGLGGVALLEDLEAPFGHVELPRREQIHEPPAPHVRRHLRALLQQGYLEPRPHSVNRHFYPNRPSADDDDPLGHDHSY